MPQLGTARSGGRGRCESGRINAGMPTDQNSLALPGAARKISPGSRRSTSWSGREPAREADRQEHAVKRAYLEDLAPGQVFTSDARAAVDAASIKRFSGEFDRQPFHLDEAAAQTTFFGEMVASGWHTTAITMQLIVDTLPLSHGIIGSGVDELRWPRPVRPGRHAASALRDHRGDAVQAASVARHRAGADDDAQPEGPAGANDGCKPAGVSPARARRLTRTPLQFIRAQHVRLVV